MNSVHYCAYDDPKLEKLMHHLRTKPVRTCYSQHKCCLCKKLIKNGEQYHDGGYGRRAHTKCCEYL